MILIITIRIIIKAVVVRNDDKDNNNDNKANMINLNNHKNCKL